MNLCLTDQSQVLVQLYISLEALCRASHFSTRTIARAIPLERQKWYLGHYHPPRRPKKVIYQRWSSPYSSLKRALPQGSNNHYSMSGPPYTGPKKKKKKKKVVILFFRGDDTMIWTTVLLQIFDISHRLWIRPERLLTVVGPGTQLDGRVSSCYQEQSHRPTCLL